MFGNTDSGFKLLFENGLDQIEKDAPIIASILEDEYQRQKNVLMMVASCSIVSPSVLACQGMPLVNVTAEGYPGNRYHAGCSEIDRLEEETITLAKKAFGAQYANVQPHSAFTANEIVMYSFLNPGDPILGLRLSSGGHLSHGAKVSYSGTYFHAYQYNLDQKYRINYEQVREMALEYRPKMIVAGTTAYTREIDFQKFREIADEVGALLLADISHIAGLVVAGLHPSPINYAHITTTCTHKQLFGPRGGLILSGRDADKTRPGSSFTIAERLQKAVFPFFQGAPIMNQIAAKGMALQLTSKPKFIQLMKDIKRNAALLAESFLDMGYDVISGGTDTHLVLIDLSSRGIDGKTAEHLLEQCNIIVNRNSVPNNRANGNEPVGIRLGSNILSQRGFSADDIRLCAGLVDMALTKIPHEKNIETVEKVRGMICDQVKRLCDKYPIQQYG